jgi:hypothetical protein
VEPDEGVLSDVVGFVGVGHPGKGPAVDARLPALDQGGERVFLPGAGPGDQFRIGCLVGGWRGQGVSGSFDCWTPERVMPFTSRGRGQRGGGGRSAPVPSLPLCPCR